MKIMAKYPSRHRVGLGGILKLTEKGGKSTYRPCFFKGVNSLFQIQWVAPIVQNRGDIRKFLFYFSILKSSSSG